MSQQLHHQAPSERMSEIVMELYEGCGAYLEESPSCASLCTLPAGALETLPRETGMDEEGATSTFGETAAGVPSGGECDSGVEVAGGGDGAADGMSAMGFDHLERFACAAACCETIDEVRFLI